MTVAFVNDADVTNGTAGTSIVVSRPTGTTDGHVLVAFVAMTNLATVTPPAGWNLIGSQDASTNTRIAAYYKVASSEPTSWTWTLGSAQRNWGWVGAYSGVKTSAPIHDSQGTSDTTAGTAFALSPSVEITSGGAGVSAVSAVRTASGTATTWTGSSTNERADLSTNAGAGTDIAGCVQETVYTGVPTGNHLPSWTASQSQTAGAMFAITLQAEFLAPAAGARVGFTVEAAFGADPDGDPDLWAWTDITQDVLDEPGILAKAGRDERGAIDQPANPTEVALKLRNWRPSGVTRTREGQYTPDNPDSPNYPDVIQYVPLRIVQPYGYTGTTTRYTVFVDSWRPSWDESGRAAFVDVTAYGRLQRIREEGRPIHSALHRRMLGLDSGGITPHAYYPCEDGSGATRVASALPGHQPLQVTGQVSFGGASDLEGSDPLPTVAENGVIGGALGPGYTATGQWAVMVALKLPETPVAVESRLISVRCTGTAMDWSLWMVPGSPDTFNIRATTWGSSLLDDPLAIVEADHYGQWRMYTILVTQNGANVDWLASSDGPDSGVSNSGTLAGRTIGTARTVRIVAFSALAGMAAGHIALYTDPDFGSFDITRRAFAGLAGNAGDWPHDRFLRLCEEEGIPATHDWPGLDETAIQMGPQRSANLGDLFDSCADTGQAIIHDAYPDGSLFFAAREARYNQDPTITLDGNLGQIPADVRPVFDGQGRVTDSTVTRDGGSSARYVAAGVRGSKPDAKTLSLEHDQHLLEIAGWRVNLGNQAAMRYTSLPFNLRRNPSLAESWFNAGIGARMQATNMVTAAGPSDPDGIIVGWTETIRRDNWVVAPVLAPARPYDVPVLESGTDTTWRLETGGSELASSATSSATSLSVTVTGDALWSTTDEPWDIDVNGERMTVTAVAGASSPQTFTVTRGVAGGAAAKAHDAGVTVKLWHARGLAL